MASVMLSALAGLGAARHFVSIAEALLARGHRVSVVSGEVARRHYAHLEVDFHAVPEQPLPDMLQTLPPIMQRARQVYARVQQTVIEPLPEQWDVVRRVLRDAAIDVVVTDALFIGGSALALVPKEVRPPVIAVGCFPPWMPDPALPPYGMGAVPSDDGASRVRSTLFELIATPAFAGLSRYFATEVQRTLGVQTHGDIRISHAAADAWLQLTVPRFEYTRRTLPANFRFIGPLRPPRSAPLPDWWDPIAEPPVIGVRADGRTAVRDLVLPTIAAFGGTAETVVIAGVGREAVEAASSQPLPPNVHFETHMPWARFIQQRSVVITDGDYLHTQHALRCGVPVVVTGTLETDVETGARVAWSSAGVRLRRRRPDPVMLRRAVHRIRVDPSFRRGAARIAAQIEQTDAEGAICDLVEEHAGLYV